MRKVLVGVLAVVACGGGSEPATFNPSGPGSTPINQLSAADATKLCTEELTHEENAFSPASEAEYTCRAEGYDAVGLAATDTSTDAEIQAFCKVGYDACKSNPPAPPAGAPIATVCADAMAQVTTCTATVDQYAACVNERFALVPKLIVPCNQLTRAKLLEIVLTADGPACQTFAAACPDLAGSEMMRSPLELMKKK
jgi:hypothetical protein